MTGKATARAHPIQGLVKYHGMRDEELRFPYHDSISLCTAPTATTTTVEWEPDASEDTYVIGGDEVDGRAAERIDMVVDHVRDLAGVDAAVRLESENSFPSNIGFGSSSSGFAAAALALVEAAGMDLSLPDVSTIARRGSSSAARAVTGAYSRLDAGLNDDDCRSYRLDVGTGEDGFDREEDRIEEEVFGSQEGRLEEEILQQEGRFEKEGRLQEEGRGQEDRLEEEGGFEEEVLGNRRRPASARAGAGTQDRTQGNGGRVEGRAEAGNGPAQACREARQGDVPGRLEVRAVGARADRQAGHFEEASLEKEGGFEEKGRLEEEGGRQETRRKQEEVQQQLRFGLIRYVDWHYHGAASGPPHSFVER